MYLADVTFRFPPGTLVKAYGAAVEDAGHPKPIGPVLDEAVVEGDGSLTLDLVGGGNVYMLAAEVEGEQRLMRATTSPTSDYRVPTGPAGGVLGGDFPNPGFALDMATQAELDPVKEKVDNLQIINICDRDYGAIGSGTSDDTLALEGAFLDAKTVANAVILIPPGVFGSTKRIPWGCGGLTVMGWNPWESRIRAMGADTYLLDMAWAGEEEKGTWENHAIGNKLIDLTLDGYGRKYAIAGLRTHRQQSLFIQNVFSHNFKYEAWFAGISNRECLFDSIDLRWSGDASHPQFWLFDDGTADGANNITFGKFQSIYGAGENCRIDGFTGGVGPTRTILFDKPMLHGPAFTFPWINEWGYEYVEEAEWRRHKYNLRIRDARSVTIFRPRLHASARGCAKVLIENGAAGAASRQYARIIEPNMGEPLNWEEMPVTPDPTEDTFTRTEGKALYLSTGAVVRIVSSGEMPGGTATATDYWCTRLADGVVKISTSRANMEAETFVNVTSAGTGVVKLVPRDIDVELVKGEVVQDWGERSATKDGQPHTLNTTGIVNAVMSINGLGTAKFTVVNTSDGGIEIYVTGKTFAPFKIDGAGTIWMGDGSELAERMWYRPIKGTIRTDQLLLANGQITAGSTIAHVGERLGLFGTATAKRGTVTGSRSTEPAKVLETLLKAIGSAAGVGLVVDSSTA